MKSRRISAHRRTNRRGRARWMAVILLAAGSTAGALSAGGAGAAPPGSGASRIELKTGAEYHLRRWRNDQGKLGASQSLLPVDVTWRRRAFRLAAGADFARSDAVFPDGVGADVSPGEFRAGSEVSLLRDRLRVAAGARVPFSAAGLGPGEARTADLLDEVALGFPRARHPGGPRLLVELGAQPVRLPGLLVQAGTAWERRSAYDVLADGRRLQPGDRWRVAGGIGGGRGEFVGDIGLCWEKAGESVLGGGYSYREGNTVTARIGARRQFDRSRLEFAGAVAARAHGSVEAGAPLDPMFLRGGNATRLVLSGTRYTSAGEFGASLGLFGVRGYAGDLGHTDAIEPGLSWAPRLAGGRLDLAVRGSIGRCRGDHPLRGLDVALSFQRAWRR